MVELDEGHAELAGEPGPERGFAAAAQTDERDSVLARTVRAAVFADELGPDPGELRRRQALEELQNQRELDRLSVVGANELIEGEVQRLGDLAQQQHRDVAAPRFELGEIALRHARIAREDLPRHPPPGTCFADALPEPVEERRVQLDDGPFLFAGRLAARLAGAHEI